MIVKAYQLTVCKYSSIWT